ncbi:MAG: DUF1499 domain-containing protein [Pseudomonadota bacterium]
MSLLLEPSGKPGMKLAILFGLAALGAFLIYVRVAPSDPSYWHVSVTDAADPGWAGVKLHEVTGSLLCLNDVALASGATGLAGSPEEGRVTWIVRSPILSFPDYITAEQTDAGLHILSRLRFGAYDWGVNRRRIEDWITRL